MKITYNYGQSFELLEVDLCNNLLIFKTKDNMKKFKSKSYIDYEELENGDIIFKIKFECIKCLNIIETLWNYLIENNLIYLCD